MTFNYIKAFKIKFDKEPTEDEIAIMMQSVAKEDQKNLKKKIINKNKKVDR